MDYCTMKYTSRKGAGCRRSFPPEKLDDEVAKRLRARECCTVTYEGREVGRVWVNQDDGNRGKWRWYTENL